jgi:hypothetical protein
LKQYHVIADGFGQEIPDDLGVSPPPFCVQMRITDFVESSAIRQVQRSLGFTSDALGAKKQKKKGRGNLFQQWYHSNVWRGKSVSKQRNPLKLLKQSGFGSIFAGIGSQVRLIIHSSATLQ